MKNTPDSRRLINTELATRGANQRIKNVIADHTPKEEQDNLKIDFYCECSDESCREHVQLTLEEFEDLHDHQSKFVIAKGHETPSVEHIVKSKHTFEVVQKPALT